MRLLRKLLTLMKRWKWYGLCPYVLMDILFCCTCGLHMDYAVSQKLLTVHVDCAVKLVDHVEF